MSGDEKPVQVRDFEFLIDTALENFVIASNPFGDPLQTMAIYVKEAFLSTKALIEFGLSNPEPGKDHPLMDSYSETIRSIVEYNVTKDSEFANHVSTIREAIVGVGFMTVKRPPVPFIKDMIDASQYYANRILQQNRGVEKHILFVTKVSELFRDLLDYVKKHFVTGFTWGAIKEKPRGVHQLGGSANYGPIPPPPPPPPAFGDIRAGGDGGRQALLEQLNQGSNITQNLRPVSRDGTVCAQPARQGRPTHGAANATASSAQPSQPAQHPPKFLLEGRKWVVEYQKNQQGIVVNNDSMSQSVSLFKCDNSSLSVERKINMVVIDSCRKTNLTLDSVISSVEMIRCDRVKLQCNGTVPLINLDNCDSVQIFVSGNSRNVEVISSKSNSCNICLLEEDGTYNELAIPEQIKTVLQGQNLVSSVIEKN